MPVWSGVSEATSSPATSSNRTRAQAVTELCYYTGGSDNAIAKVRAGTAWDRAVRDYNGVAWRFNRQYQDYTLPTSFDSSGESALPDDFRSASRLMLLNSDGETVDFITFRPWREWTLTDPSHGVVGGGPNSYTFRNEHSSHKIVLDPIPDQTATYTYPTLRLHYHTRIELAPADDNLLDVPVEVDEAIFALALAKFIKMQKGAKESLEYERDASFQRSEVEREWRDYRDFEIC